MLDAGTNETSCHFEAPRRYSNISDGDQPRPKVHGRELRMLRLFQIEGSSIFSIRLDLQLNIQGLLRV